MKLLETQKELIGESYIFDGSMLFLQKVIGEISVEVDMQQFNEGSPEEAPGSPSKQRLVITPTTQIKPGDHAPLQLYNMIFRKVCFYSASFYHPDFENLEIEADWKALL